MPLGRPARCDTLTATTPSKCILSNKKGRAPDAGALRRGAASQAAGAALSAVSNDAQQGGAGAMFKGLGLSITIIAAGMLGLPVLLLNMV